MFTPYSSVVSPLYPTTMHCSLEKLLSLLKEGLDPNTLNSSGDSLLHTAVSNSNFPIAKVLLDYSASPNSANQCGDTPLHYAASRKDPRMVHLLLSYSADPNQANFSLHRTPLHNAILARDLESIKKLLSHQGDLSAFDRHHTSPLDLATSALSESISRLLSDKSMLTIIEEEEEELQTEGNFKDLTEPEAESLSHRKSELSRLREFLATLALEHYFEDLVNAGFDDLHSLFAQMDTPMPITLELLETAGVERPGHRARLLMKLHAGELNALKQYQELSLRDWLAELKLEKLYEQFVDSGYEHLELLREHMESLFPITDAVLKYEIKVEKPGHRLRILGKLLDEVRFERSSHFSEALHHCQMCTLL